MATANDAKLTSKAQKFLAKGPLKSFIGGKWVASANGEKLPVADPGTGKCVVEFYVMQESDVDKAVKAGAKAFQSSGWAAMSPNERGVYLHKLADLIDRDQLNHIDQRNQYQVHQLHYHRLV